MIEHFECSFEEMLMSKRQMANSFNGFKIVADISTRHITKNDCNYLMPFGHFHGAIGAYEYGHFVSTYPGGDPDQLSELKAMGFSEVYLDILRKLNDAQIYYCAFDQDGFIIKDWPQFDW